MSDGFLFDDFFADDSDTVTEPITLRDKSGNERVVPITFKRSITLADRKAAELKALTYEVDPETKQPVLKDADENKFTIELLSRIIVAWPFTNRDGSPVPVTRDAIAKLVDSGDALYTYVGNLIQAKKASLDAFAPASDAVSSQAA